MKTAPYAIALLTLCCTAPAIAGGPAQAPDPVALTRPLAPETIARMLDEAEAAYRARRWTQAMDAFKAVTAFDADNPQAWLRIGNLHQRRSQWLAAASAYRKAAREESAESASAHDTGQSPAPSPTVRTKALLNLASVNLEMARAALTELGPIPPDLASMRDDVDTQSRALGTQLQRLQGQPDLRGDAASRKLSSGEPLGPQQTADDAASVRPTAVPSRQRTAAGTGAAAPRPSVEYLKGASVEI
jgi:hypothetical protein